MPNRAPLSEEFKQMRSWIQELVPILEAKPEWYGSVYIERKELQGFAADYKKTNLSQDSSFGFTMDTHCLRKPPTMWNEAT